MQTADQLMNDLIEALQISSTYRQQQEQQWKLQVAMAPIPQENYLKKTINLH